MYPYRRALGVLLAARRRPQVTVATTGVVSFLAWPWDADIFFEVNNGRQLTLFELGRWDLAMRSGLVAAMRRHRWGLVVAGASVRYRKRIRPFARIRCITRLEGVDDRWIWMAQSFWVGSSPCTAGLFRTAVTGRAGVVAPAVVLAELGMSVAPGVPEWVRSWHHSDAARPWPPPDGAAEARPDEDDWPASGPR